MMRESIDTGPTPSTTNLPASSNAPGTTTFIDDPARRQRLHIALHLLQHTDFAVVFTGPNGSGKSTLLARLVSLGGNSVRAARITCVAEMRAAHLLNAILDEFKLPHDATSIETQLTLLRDHLDALRRKSYTPWIVLDEAHHLARECRDLAEQVADLCDDAGKVLCHLVAATTEHNPSFLARRAAQQRVKIIDVPQFSVDDTRNYLQQYWQHSSASAIPFDDLFTARTVTRIHRAARGWPGAINPLAIQIIAEFNPRAPQQARRSALDTARLMKIAAGVVSAVVIGAVFLYQDEINHWIQTPSSSTASAVRPSTPMPLTSSPPTPATPTPPPPSTPPPSNEPSALDVPATTPERLTAPAEPTTTVAAATKKLPAATEENPTTHITLQREPWLLAQDPEHYAVQIFGAERESDVVRAAKRFSFDVPLAYFKTSRNDKTWYGLIAGVYPDRAQALAAVSRLPQNFARLAWVRKMSAVQTDINEDQQDSSTPPEATTSPAADEAKRGGEEPPRKEHQLP